ncbi:MAG: hypothetical protein ACI4MB_01820 [Candidatus Coproplasma sp.]
MIKQNNLEYYLGYLTEETLFAYGECYEFFRSYDRKRRQWIISKISFSQLLHDFRVEQIDKEKAKELTGDNLPIEAYCKYCDMLSNRS